MKTGKVACSCKKACFHSDCMVIAAGFTSVEKMIQALQLYME